MVETREPSAVTTLEPDLDQLAADSYDIWFESDAQIRSHDGLELIRPTLNAMQEEINAAIEWCEVNEQPCRIIVLKNRKEGASTYFTGKGYHLCRSSVAHLLEIGDQFSTTQTIWDILRTFQERDQFGWPNKLEAATQSAQQGHASWSHGSTAWCDTAGDKRAGQSKTPTVILADEVAHWGRDGAAANAADTMLALLNSIVEAAGTYVFVSSTANGVGNWYHRTYQGAVTLDQRESGDKGNGWIKVFFPWHRSQWTQQLVSDRERNEILSTLTEPEKRGIELWNWTVEQIAWRRSNIATKCDGDESKFNQENPESEEAAFLASGRPVFNAAGMTRLEVLAKHAQPKCGILDKNNAGVLWVPDESGWLTVWEQPCLGLSYVSSLDTCAHEQALTAKDPDEHSFWVLRTPYYDASGRLVPIRAVCRIRPPCRWDATLLAEKIILVLKWFGNCMIVPEVNKGMDVLVELRRLGANIYRRQPKFDRINPGQTQTGAYGWETGDTSDKTGTRSVLVKAIIDAVREQRLDVECPQAIKQMNTFVWNTRGKACASAGNHDDDVMALGIGLACIKSASVYKENHATAESIEAQRGYLRDRRALQPRFKGENS